LVRFDRHLSTP